MVNTETVAIDEVAINAPARLNFSDAGLQCAEPVGACAAATEDIDRNSVVPTQLRAISKSRQCLGDNLEFLLRVLDSERV
jgi:hypothetical protein